MQSNLAHAILIVLNLGASLNDYVIPVHSRIVDRLKLNTKDGL